MPDGSARRTPSPWQVASWLAVAAVLMTGLYATSSAITPFLIAAVIAYMGVPSVDELVNKGLNRTGATCVVLVVLMLAILLLPLALLPIIISQAIEVVRGVPDAFSSAWSWLIERIPGLSEKDLSTEGLGSLTDNLSLGGAGLEKVADFLGALVRNVGATFGFIATLLITPLVAFYLMRDWHGLIQATARNIPAPVLPTVTHVASIADRTLSEFLRGQVTVMLIMAVVYSVLLTVTGAPFAIAIGVITGLLCFVPYIGFFLGFFLVAIVTLLDFQSWGGVAWPLAAMCVGTLIEGFWLTPKIVGDRIGLGPVSVLLALSVMGSLFGFAGMLMAIPVAAVVFALWRHYLPSFTGREDEGAV